MQYLIRKNVGSIQKEKSINRFCSNDHSQAVKPAKRYRIASVRTQIRTHGPNLTLEHFAGDGYLAAYYVRPKCLVQFPVYACYMEMIQDFWGIWYMERNVGFYYLLRQLRACFLLVDI